MYEAPSIVPGKRMNCFQKIRPLIDKSTQRRLSALLVVALVAISSERSALAGDLGSEGVELIQGDVLSHFQPAKGWAMLESVEADGRALNGPPHDGTGGILNNGSVKGRFDYLYTAEEYGDLSLSLEFMVPARSNSGIYFLGRYEIQLLDSYGVDKPKFSDLGALYQRWDDARGKGNEGFEGIPPRVNAAKAPGEWQKVEVVFRAPRFDQDGNKIKNAFFESVHVNDILVQENVEARGPTRSHQLEGDAAYGPIVIQGDHGPIAIRSMIVKSLGGKLML